jgi:hypothetical protein
MSALLRLLLPCPDMYIHRCDVTSDGPERSAEHLANVNEAIAWAGDVPLPITEAFYEIHSTSRRRALSMQLYAPWKRLPDRSATP